MFENYKDCYLIFIWFLKFDFWIFIAFVKNTNYQKIEVG